MSGRTPDWLLALAAVTCIATVPLDGLNEALATPSRDFATESTRSLFGTIRLLGGVDAQGHANLRIVADAPADVYVVTNTVAPGGHSGWHTHPGPSLVLVKAGTATVYDSGDPACVPATYPAGSGFVDEGGGHVHLVRNAGNVRLELVAFQMIPAGAARRIDAPDPGFCRDL